MIQKLSFAVLFCFFTILSLNSAFAAIDNETNNSSNIAPMGNSSDHKVLDYTNQNSSANHAAGEASISFTNQQVIKSAGEVKDFIEIKHTLPTLITVNGVKITQAQFLHILTTVSIKINNSDNTLTTLLNVNLPTTTAENTKPGTLTQNEYTNIAQNIQTYINTNQKAPNTITSSVGTIGFKSLIYMYSRALNLYNTNKALPTFLAIRPWGTIPITDTTKKSITINDITQTATQVKGYTEYYKTLPEYININGILVNQATFLQLLTQTTIKLNTGSSTTTTLTLTNTNPPTTGTETVKMGTLTQNEYTNIAQNIQTYINTNQKAPNTITSSVGTIKFESLIYMYSRALNLYNTNKALPTYLIIKTWTTNNIPITDTTKKSITINDIIQTATQVKGYTEYYKTLPEYININGILVNQATFLQLLTQTTIKLNTGSSTTTTLTLTNTNPPTTGTETVKMGTLTQNEYTNIAQNIQTYINTNQKAPNTITSSVGTIKFESLIYMYSRALNLYNTNKALPTYLIIKTWTTNNIPITDTTKKSITINDIIQTATQVKGYTEYYKTLPEYININGILVNQATFLQLLTQTTIKLNTGSSTTTTLTLTNTNPPTTGTETVKMGTLTQNEYTNIAQNIQTYINTNQKAPNTITSSLGTIKFESLIYMYSRVLNKYNSNSNTLPSLTTIKKWSTSNIPILDSFFTTKEIVTTAIEVKGFIEYYKTLPTLITINGVQLNQAQFLQLLTSTTLKIHNKDNSLTNLQKAALPNNNSENMVSGSIGLSEILQLAQKIKTYIENNKRASGYFSSSLGDISFTSQIYLFSRVMDYYNSHKTLPTTVTGIKPWALYIYNLPASYEAYLYSSRNCQSNNAAIIDLANRITVGSVTPYDKALRIFNWVRDAVEYEFYYNTSKGALGTMYSLGGNCCDITHLLIALSRASGLAARYEHGYCFFTYSKTWYGHVWGEIFVNNVWVTADGSNNINEFGIINNWDTASFRLQGTYSSLPF